MTFRSEISRPWQRRASKLFKSFRAQEDGAAALEFALCSLFIIPLFLGMTDVSRAVHIQKNVSKTGDSILRAMVHVPEYDGSMRKSLERFCEMNRHENDTYDIEIASGTYTGASYNISWKHSPCGANSSVFTPITFSELNDRLGSLTLRDGEGFIAVKIVHVAKSLETSKFLYAPENHTFEYLDASIPRIANTVLYTNDNLYDINSYEY